MAFALHTNAFPANGEIPTQYTCSGADISPQLAWTEIPAGTQSLALIVDDPDAPRGTFTHWVLYNLAPQTTELQEELPKTGQLPGAPCRGKTISAASVTADRARHRANPTITSSSYTRWIDN